VLKDHKAKSGMVRNPSVQEININTKMKWGETTGVLFKVQSKTKSWMCYIQYNYS